MPVQVCLQIRSTPTRGKERTAGTTSFLRNLWENLTSSNEKQRKLRGDWAKETGL